MKVCGKVGYRTMSNGLNFGGDPDHRLDTGIAFRIRHCWEIRKVVSTDCAKRRYSAGHALAGIAMATTTLRHRPLAEACVSQWFWLLLLLPLQYVLPGFSVDDTL